jgi:class 3 adenylate cyclase
MDLYRIQIRPLARRWDMDEFTLLSAFLKATRAGLLQMSWDVICPHCRGVRSEVKTLGEVPSRGECKACGIDFDTDGENSIEITFHVHPSIRAVEQVFYCSAEPAKKAHIKLFQLVPPKGTLRVPTRLGPGRYRLRTASERTYRLLEVRSDAQASELRWAADAANVPPVHPDPTLTLVNDHDAERSFTLEESGWSDDALRPSQLLSFQDFRDLFTEEYLGSDVQLSVGRQTIFFSDVVGSTRLYATRGDPGAFADVKRHFTEVYDVVKKHHGAIVKTIGDAAMAAFPSPLEALRASRELQERLPPEREDLQIRVRISLNTGPCIAVNLNTNMDYFGNTVNLAAKLQACASAGQIAFPAEVLEHPGVRELLEKEGASTEEIVFDTPTVGRPLNVIRWDAFAGRPSRRKA